MNVIWPIMADNSFCLAFDNLTSFSEHIANALCGLSTGGGFSTKELWEGREEEIFVAKRPQILNGIADLITRPDLVERTIFITLQPISHRKRKLEKELVTRFAQEQGKILGALLDGISTGLRRFNDIVIKEKPRMVDFAKWVTACETAFWPAGTFLPIYLENIAEAKEKVIEARCALFVDNFSWLLSSGPAHAFAGELNAVCVGNETVQDAVGMGQIANDFILSSGNWEVIIMERRSILRGFSEDHAGQRRRGFLRCDVDGVHDAAAERCQGRWKSPAPSAIALTILSVMCW
jgi:hypothetical protein